MKAAVKRKVWRKCRSCKGNIVGVERNSQSKQKFCTRQCAAHFHTSRILSRTAHLARGVTGSISELRVAVDLLGRGFEVFRALSSACSCDLVVLVNKRLYRVEVRTAHTGYTDKRKRLRASIHKVRADILALVGRKKIAYRSGRNLFGAKLVSSL